ncbi:hypothetical protein L5515_014589 [Caenorhabditis briggsae]|uniref:Uncharacterized protein n=1 Tax=Caenorhabditis briggsae TaxID=6238 RepID=A0AAE9EGP3_CAEBR|nr:hypothetical protein L5515_014589 [Caenorhabditis briggsae]
MMKMATRTDPSNTVFYVFPLDFLVDHLHRWHQWVRNQNLVSTILDI